MLTHEVFLGGYEYICGPKKKKKKKVQKLVVVVGTRAGERGKGKKEKGIERGACLFLPRDGGFSSPCAKGMKCIKKGS